MRATMPPVGERISLAYYPKSENLADSQKFRKRIISFLVDKSTTDPLLTIIPQEIGRDIVFAPMGINWTNTLNNLTTLEFLDTLTLLVKRSDSGRRRIIQPFVQRVLQEESLAYRMDELGGFHPLVDQAFEVERIELISRLGQAGYAAAATAYREAMDALAPGAPDTLRAVRSVIDAVENVFKLASAEKRIGASEIKSKLPLLLPQQLDGRARDASLRMIASFAEWANASHQYRHADAQPDPTPPPLDLAVQFMSSASGWLRWLMALDASQRAVPLNG